jgi:hypothetical protein
VYGTAWRLPSSGMGKLRRLIDGLKELRSAGPGKRFEAHYDRAHDPRWNYGVRGLVIVAGVLLICLGLLLSLIPVVPGTVLSIVGAGLVAAESRAAARGLDWVEMKLRRAIRRFRGSSKR